eukprot:scaffold6196_cov113-Isochrysis_galbana.AAC.6
MLREGERALGIGQRPHFLLLQKCHLVSVEPVIARPLKQPADPGVGVVRRHDGERQLDGPARALRRHGLHSPNVPSVRLQHSRVSGALGGKLELDSGEAESLAQPARRNHEPEALGLQQAERFVPATGASGGDVSRALDM